MKSLDDRSKKTSRSQSPNKSDLSDCVIVGMHKTWSSQRKSFSSNCRKHLYSWWPTSRCRHKMQCFIKYTHSLGIIRKKTSTQITCKHAIFIRSSYYYNLYLPIPMSYHYRASLVDSPSYFFFISPKQSSSCRILLYFLWRGVSVFPWPPSPCAVVGTRLYGRE